MKLSAVTLVLSFYVLAGLGLSACTQSEPNVPKPPGTDANSHTNDVGRKLGTLGIDHTIAGFSTQNRALVPCDEKLLGALKSSVEELTIVEAKLRREGQTDDAIWVSKEFLIALTPLQVELTHYCQLDADKIQSCLDAEARIFVILNQNESFSRAVTPLVAPYGLKKTDPEQRNYGLIPYSSDGRTLETRYTRVVDAYDSGLPADTIQMHPTRETWNSRDVYGRSSSSLGQSAQCLQNESLQTKTGQAIQKLIEDAASTAY